MSNAWLYVMALLSNVIGLSWIALSMDVHWRQIRGSHPLAAHTSIVLRMLGVLALILSLSLCVRADHPSMASLVWIMSLAAAALSVAFTLAWRPRWLAPLILHAGNNE